MSGRRAAPAVATSSRAIARTSRLGIAVRAPRHLPRLALSTPRPRERAEAVLDRIVRGRAWIPVLAVMLIGIVAMQVEVLKLGASSGRSMNTVSELQSQIQRERVQVSALDSPARIEGVAASMGLTQPGPTGNHFVSGNTSVPKAIAGIHPVNASSFAANLLAEQAADDAPTPVAGADSAGATGATGPAATSATSATSGTTGTTGTSGTLSN